MTRIFIENYELDLTGEISQQLTFSVDDIRNLDSKTTSFSKTIIIPGTQRNNKIFGNIYELSNANFPGGQVNAFYDFDASRTAQAMIDINGLQAMKGTLRLLSITVDNGAIEYEVALFGELGGFMSAVGNKKLEDIDLSKYDHSWNVGNITGGWQDSNIFDVTNTYAISGPFSTDKYDIVYKIRINSINASKIQPFDKIKLSGTGSNNSIFTVAQVFWSAVADNTTIYVFEPLVDESGVNMTITLMDEDGYGYVYPLIDYGSSDPSGGLSLHPKDWQFQTFRPAFYVLEYLNNIITGAGYTWESRFFDTKFFRSLIVPNNDIALERRGETFFIQASNDTYYESLNYADNGDHIITFTDSTINNFTNSSGIYTYTGLSTTNIKIKARLNMYLYGPVSTLKFTFYKNGQPAAEYTGPYNQNGPLGGYGDTALNLEATLSVSSGDTIAIGYYFSFPMVYGDLQIDFTGKSNTIEVLQDPPGFVQYLYDDMLNMNNVIPKNVYQKDLFTSIMKMFNLMVVERKDKNKHLVIEPYVDFYNTDRATYLDWSYNVNREKPIQIKPMSEINARLYDFKFKEDSDYLNDDYKKRFNQTYGNRTFDNNLEFAKDSQTVEIIFSPTPLIGYEDEVKVFPGIYKFNNNLRSPMAHNIRIMQIKRVSDVTTWDIYNDTTKLTIGLTNYLYAGHLNDPDYPYVDINWGATKQLYFNLASGSLQYNLFNNFYSPYMAEIIDKDSRLVTCEMKLTEQDIFNLDFSRFVMVDGVLFRVVKIYDWSEGSLSKVDLLRVINTTYIPDSPATAKTLRLRFNDLAGWEAYYSVSATDLTTWKTLFNLASGEAFSSVYIDGNDVILLGNVGFNILDSTFEDDTFLIGLWDNIGAVQKIEDNAFKGSAIEIFHSQSAVFAGQECFNNASNLYDISIPKCEAIQNLAFSDCSSLLYIDFSGVKFMGDDPGINQIFSGIYGNNISMTINSAVTGDDDVINLLNSNTVNLTIV